MPPRKMKDTNDNVCVTCPYCGRANWVPKSHLGNELLLRCDRCTPTQICPRCGRQYKKAHTWCPPEKKNKPDALTVINGERPKLRRWGPRDRDRFCTVLCLHKVTEFHLADIKTTGTVHAHCDRLLIATMPLPAIQIAFWGLLGMDATETDAFAGPWCRRCLALAVRLLGRETKFRVAREALE